MAVIKVVPSPVSKGRVESRKNNLLREVLGRIYTQEFTVYTDTALDGPNVVLKDALVPQMGTAYNLFNDDDALATCVGVECDRTKSQKIFKVTATFDTDRIVSLVTDNPLMQPPDIQWVGETYTRAMTRDAYGIPYVSSSKNAFDPPRMREIKYGVARVTRNEPSYSATLAKQYWGKLNKAVYSGYDPLCVRVNKIDGHFMVSNGVFFAQVAYELEFREESFRDFILDQDFRDSTGLLFLDRRTAQPLSNPTPLNGRGKSLYESKSKLQIAMNNTTDTTVKILASDITKFPPARKAPNADGIILGPRWLFKVRIGDEIMEVTAGADTDTFTVTRAVEGTTKAAHAVGADVLLEPYYLAFLPAEYCDFDDLDLPDLV